MNDVCQAFESPWLTYSLMESGDVVIDRDTGEWVPAEQVVSDPLRDRRISHLNGCEHNECGSVEDDYGDEESSLESVDEGFVLGEEEEGSFDPIASLSEDDVDDDIDVVNPAVVMASPCTCSAKARHPEAGNDKLDGDRRHRPRSTGRHGKQVYKDGRLRRVGSDKTRSVKAIW